MSHKKRREIQSWWEQWSENVSWGLGVGLTLWGIGTIVVNDLLQDMPVSTGVLIGIGLLLVSLGFKVERLVREIADTNTIIYNILGNPDDRWAISRWTINQIRGLLNLTPEGGKSEGEY